MKSVPRASVLLALCLLVGGACAPQRVSDSDQAAAGRAVAGGCSRWRRAQQRPAAPNPPTRVLLCTSWLSHSSSSKMLTLGTLSLCRATTSGSQVQAQEG
jgi:hypothetical protein